MNRIVLVMIMVIIIEKNLNAQSIGIGTTTPDNSAKLDVTSTDKGLLVPRMTAAQRAAIIQPATGLIVYQSDGTSGFYYNAGTTITPSWLLLINSATAITSIGVTSPISSTGGTAPTLKISGAPGGVMYGTGIASNFTATGTPGFFLKSNGTAAPTFELLGQSAQTVFGTGSITVTPSMDYTIIPGLTKSFTVPNNASVIITSDGGLNNVSGVAAGFSSSDIVITIDGTFIPSGGFQRVIAANSTGIFNMIAHWSMSEVVTLAPGTHTVQVVVAGNPGGVSATVSGDVSSINQGQLTVIILKD